MFIALIAILLLVPTGFAGYISISLTTEDVLINNNSGITKIKMQNLGNEAAFNVVLSILSEDFESDTISVGTLNPNDPKELNISLSPKEGLLPGSYSVGILVQYEDANGYRFSSVSPNRITYKTYTISDAYGLIESLNLSEKGSLRIRIRNAGEKEHNIRIRLYTPNELVASEKEKYILIRPKEDKEIAFSIFNYGGLLGSSYVVFASLDYWNDLHYSGIARGMISIQKKDYSFFFIGLALVLLSIFVIINIKFKKRLTDSQLLQGKSKNDKASLYD
ncbi:MAG: hypothetical protein QXQ40_02150 [Candidatus Aenigmatarchaeota archaeon]